MALSRGASNPDPDPDDIRPLKPCLLRRNHNRDQHGVAASCLEELRRKACEVLAIDESQTPVTLVLAEDGTIVDDDDYFLCLPSNTKFVALACNEKWTYNNSDGGTAWVSQESFDADETDSGAGVKWKNVARQLKKDLSSIILLSEEDLQVLIDVPCSELAQELCQSCATVQRLQDTLQRVLDQREEARQSKQLLELYLRALEKEGAIFSNQEEPKAALGGDADAVDTGISKEMASEVALTSQILTVLKEKPAPELSLSSQDLELVSKEDPRALAVALSGDIKKAETVQRACSAELARRLQQVQSLRSLRNVSTLLEGLMLGSMSIFYKAEKILWAAGATTLVTLVLTLSALQTKWDFTMLNGVMFVFFVVLMIYGIIALVVESYWLYLISGVFSTWNTDLLQVNEQRKLAWPTAWEEEGGVRRSHGSAA